MSMLFEPPQSTVTSSVPVGGKSTFWKLEPPGRTAKLESPSTVRTAWGGGVGLAVCVGPVVDPPQLEKHAKTAPAMRRGASERLFMRTAS